jgi:hypothetical protein
MIQVWLAAMLLCSMVYFPACKAQNEEESTSSQKSSARNANSKDSKPVEDGSDQDDEESDDSEDDEEETNTPPGPPAAPRYSAKIGDKISLNIRSKTWSSAESEPSDFADGPVRESLVVASYAASNSCAYRVRESASGITTYRNEKCTTTLSCRAPESTSTCTTEKQESEDLSKELKSAEKEKQICTTKQTVGEQVSLVKSITYTWKHKSVLRESLIAKTETLTCSASLAAGEAEFDPCNPPAGKLVNFSRSIEEIKEQIRGKGGAILPKSASAAIVSTDLESSPKGVSLPASCDASGDSLSVNIQHMSCDDANLPKFATISIKGLALSEGRDTPVGANNVGLSIGEEEFSNAAVGDCVISVLRDEKSVLVTGEMRCTSKLLSATSATTKSIEKLNFACPAPKQFAGMETIVSEQDTKAESASGPGASSSGGSPAPSPSTSGTASPSPSPTGSPSASPSATPNLANEQVIFLSSFKSNGDIRFGGLRGRAAADMWCNDVATKANLGGTFKAVLSTDNSTTAREHIVVRGKVYNVKAELIANSAAEFWSPNHKNAVKFDETGKDLSGDAQVMLGARVDGSHFKYQACINWTRGSSPLFIGVGLGNGAKADLGWIEAIVAPDCATMSRVYCMRQ